jgi:hypothetical protein
MIRRSLGIYRYLPLVRKYGRQVVQAVGTKNAQSYHWRERMNSAEYSHPFLRMTEIE